VEEKGRIISAAMTTPPYRLVLTPAETRVLGRIVEDLSRRRILLPGVNGPRETSLAFAEQWAKKKRCTYQLHRSLRVYHVKARGIVSRETEKSLQHLAFRDQEEVRKCRFAN
jgi:hypothetical protein